MIKKIIIISGEPKSINSEIIYKCWKKLSSTIKKKIYVISNYRLLNDEFKSLNYKIRLKKVDDIKEKESDDVLKVLNVDLNYKKLSLIKKKDITKYINNSLTLAHNLALKKNILGIINCPINKKHLKKFTGATEFFAKKCLVKNNSEVMLIKANKLAVTPITTHIDIKNVSKTINKSLIINKIRTINKWYKSFLGKKPKLVILGLNPHNAEFRKDSEEMKFIIPAVKKLKKLNFNLSGPIPADTLFIKDFKKYDVVIGMFHDQVITPLKTLFKFEAINITLGLKYLRLSPDHGIAKNIIGKNKADPKSLINCVNFINKYGR